jgi:hypothetical protein
VPVAVVPGPCSVEAGVSVFIVTSLVTAATLGSDASAKPLSADGSSAEDLVSNA